MEMHYFDPEFGEKATLALLDKSLPPTAIVAGESQLGIGMLTALNRRGLRHGKDISIVITDDLPLLHLMDPPVSVVYRDSEEMGRMAAELLMRRLKNPKSKVVHEVLPTRFISRGSITAPLEELR
jgi:DNA-binding LacI/PurR family transcriptional regulator